MRKAYGFKLQSQKNVIKLGNMIDDMWGIHLHIMLLARRYRRMFGKDVSAYKLKRHTAETQKADETPLGSPAESSGSRRCIAVWQIPRRIRSEQERPKSR